MAEALHLNRLSILVGGKKTNALLDTGASICVASKSLLSKTKHANDPLREANHPNVRGVTGNSLEVLGMLDVEIEIGGSKFIHPVHIIDCIESSFVLGVDFLQKYKVNIDYNTNKVIIPKGSNSTTVNLIETCKGLARNSMSVVLPKRSETTVLVHDSRQKNGSQILLQPRASLALKHIVGFRCFGKVENKKAYMRIMNPTFRDITLPANEVLGTVTTIDPPPIPSLSTSNPDSANDTQSHHSNSSSASKLQFDFSKSELSPEQKEILVSR